VRRLILLPLLLAAAASAQVAWFVQEENDKFTSDNADRYYTQGLRVCWSTPDRWHGSVAQEINTPSDRPGIPDDLPFSGVLTASLGRLFLLPEHRAIASVEGVAGVLGPSSRARQVQNGFHGLIGTAGYDWDRQMPDEPVANLNAEIRRRFDLDGPEVARWDLIARARASLGTLRSGVSLGAQLRFGALDQGWGHGYLRQSNSFVDPLGPEDPGRDGWCFFVDASVEVMPRDYATDGPAFADFAFEAPVESRPLVGQLGLGIQTRLDGFVFSFGVANRTKEFSGQLGSGHVFGSFRFAFVY
jgi:hypothetical protein